MREQTTWESATQCDMRIYWRQRRIIAPVFGDVKGNRRILRFPRLDLAACPNEWHLIATTHILRKLYHTVGNFADATKTRPGRFALC